MGAFLDKPNTEKKSSGGTGNGLNYGLAAMQGWRVEMEDAHCAVTGLGGHLKDWSFFAVFDGHAGAQASEYCAKQLLAAIVDSEELKKLDPESVPSVADAKAAIKEGFLKMDETMRKRPEVERGEDKSGSTAVAVLISPNHYFFANCGDSRAILISNGAVKYHTCDHKPGNPAERERIQAAGGSVMIQRVNGSLAVSRALGDFEYKNVQGKGPCEQLVSPEPEIHSIERIKDKDQMIVLACDGIWDVMSNEELAEYLLDRIRISNALDEICRNCLDTCLHKGSRDNMSIVTVALESAPVPDAKAQEREAALDAKLEADIRELMRASANEAPTPFLGSDQLGMPGFGYGGPAMPPRVPASLDINIIYSKLNAENYTASLPPKTGLACKRAKAEEIFNKYKDEFEQIAKERRRLAEQAAVGAQDEHGREGSLNSGKQLKKTGRVSSDDAEMTPKSDSPQPSKKAESPDKEKKSEKN